MHKIYEKEFTLDDFSTEHLMPDSIIVLGDIIVSLNNYRAYFVHYDELNNLPPKKDIWWQMIQLLPSSYNQTRNVMMNYEVLANIYKSRKNHKLDEWRVHKTPEEHGFRNKDFSSGMWGFCDWIESLPYSELICGDSALMAPNEVREKMGLESIKEPSESLKMYEVGKAAVYGIREGLNKED